MTTLTAFDRLVSYIQNDPGHREAKGRVAVAISRQTGSGAITIGTRLAEYMQSQGAPDEGPWAVFDKNLMAKVLEDHKLPIRLAQFLPEDRIPLIRDWIEEALGLHPEYRAIIQQSVETIMRLALLGNVILVGRGANVITSRLATVFRVRLVGSLEKRVARIEERLNLSPEKALSLIRTSDRGRARYVKKYFNKQVDDVLLYDLTLNTDRFTEDEAARLIGDAVVNHRRELQSAQGITSSRQARYPQ